jgi:hypothetical protein
MAITDNPKFQNLSPEAKKLVVEKYNSLSEEAKKIVDAKLSPNVSTKTETFKDKAIQAGKDYLSNPVNLLLPPGSSQIAQAGERYIRKGLDTTADKMAESKFGQAHPYATNAVGTVVAKAPEFAAAAGGIAAAPEIAQSLRGVGSMVRGGASKVADLAKLLVGPGKEASVAKISPQIRETEYALANSAEKLSSSKANFAKDLQEAKAALASQGPKIGKAETEAGLTLGDTAPTDAILANPKKLSTKLDQLKRVLKTPPEELSTKLDPEVVYSNMKLAQQARDAAGIHTPKGAQWSKVNTGLRKVLEKTKPDFTKELDNLSGLDTKLKSLNPKFKIESASIQEDIGKLKSRLAKLKIKSREVAEVGAKSDRYRKNVGIGAGVGTGLGLGYSAVKKLLN